MMRTRTYLAATLALLASSCGSSQETGRVTVLLKDAPSPDVRAAVVTISQVSLAGGSGPVVLLDTPVTVDLLTLASQVMTLVDGAAVPAGTYSQLRFVITGGYLDVAGSIYASSPTYEGLPAGATVAGELQMPSYARSGLKVILPGDGLVIGSDPTATWVVDFDVSQSFGHDTGTDRWVMHPVIKGTPIEETGSVAVTLALAPEAALPPSVVIGEFSATLTPVAGGDVTVLGLDALGDGRYGATFTNLAAGDYTVSFEPNEGATDYEISPPSATATVTAGATATLDFFIAGADPIPSAL
jgi:hypothetical protein